MKKRNRASRGKTKKKGKSAQAGSSGISTADELAKELYEEITTRRKTFGEEIARCEVGFTEQKIYRKGRRYALTVEWTEVYEGERCLGEGEWTQRHPRDDIFEVPRDKKRRICTLLPIKRTDAVKWLSDNIIENLIPSEFHRDFRYGIANGANGVTTLDYKTKLLCLLKLPVNATDKTIAAAIAGAAES